MNQCRRTIWVGLTIVLLLLTPLAVHAAGPRPDGLLGDPVPPPTTPGDENWSAGFQVPGLDATVFALAVDRRGNVYAGGATVITLGAPG